MLLQSLLERVQSHYPITAAPVLEASALNTRTNHPNRGRATRGRNRRFDAEVFELDQSGRAPAGSTGRDEVDRDHEPRTFRCAPRSRPTCSRRSRVPRRKQNPKRSATRTRPRAKSRSSRCPRDRPSRSPQIGEPGEVGLTARLKPGERAVSIPVRPCEGRLQPHSARRSRRRDGARSIRVAGIPPKTFTIIRGAIVLAINSQLEQISGTASPAPGDNGRRGYGHARRIAPRRPTS